MTKNKPRNIKLLCQPQSVDLALHEFLVWWFLKKTKEKKKSTWQIKHYKVAAGMLIFKGL